MYQTNSDMLSVVDMFGFYTKGHSAGDQLILNFAQLLRKVIPEEDFVGRYGGDEFMAVIYDTNKQEIEGVLEKLRIEIEQHNHNENTNCNKRFF